LLDIDTNLMIGRPNSATSCSPGGHDALHSTETGTGIVVLLAACSGGADKPAPGNGAGSKPIVLGFSRSRRERMAHRQHPLDPGAAPAAGITLRFSDAQQKQEKPDQGAALLHRQRVDVIAFSPVVETGWETVLREAKAAKIPSSSRTAPSMSATIRCTSR
jgi:hypothetical protein